MMMILTITALLAAVSGDTAASAQRAAFSKCLDEAVAKAKSAKVEVQAFDGFARTQCAASEAELRNAVIAIDVKNGVSRKEAAEYATMDTDGYFANTADQYEAMIGRSQPKAAPAQVPVQAQAEAQQPQTPQPQQ